MRRGYSLTDLTVSGLWVDGGVQEDCVLMVGWRYDGDVPKVLDVADCYGVLSGTNYLDKILVTPTLLDHIRDMILERYEV